MMLCTSLNSRTHQSSTFRNSHEDDSCRYELPTSKTPPPSRFVTSQPISLRSPYTMDDDLANSPPMEQIYSPLSSSAESISSIKSRFKGMVSLLSSSSRSSAEREIERQQRRQLLDASLLKMRASNNLPLRKHLLVYNTVKLLQRDLDLLDDEELYCNLMGEGCGERMEVDERRWPTFGSTTSPCLTSSSSSSSSSSALPSAKVAAAAAVHMPAATATVAPPQQEERRVAKEATSLITDDLDMDVYQVVQQQQHQRQMPSSTWSWSDSMAKRGAGKGQTTAASSAQSSYDLFESIQDVLGESFAGWSWMTGVGEPYKKSYSADAWWSDNSSGESVNGIEVGSGGSSAPFGSRFDSLWSLDADPLGATNLSRFELQHLFPSQVLLQA